MADNQPIAFIDLAAQQARIKDKLMTRIENVLNHGAYIMGPEVREFEAAMNDFANTKHSIACANGTDALQIALMALDVKPGDGVIVPSFTFASTAEVVSLLGAKPIFADIDADSFNISAASVERCLAAHQDVPVKGIITVDLFGRPAGYAAITAITEKHGLFLLVDAAQGYGAKFDGKASVAYGDAATTSFFPAKPLGCYGDGGAVFTERDDIADLLRSLRVHGKGTDKYDNVRIGVNSRLDTLQAAILLEKIAFYEDEIKARNTVASAYHARLEGKFQTPIIPDNMLSVWAQYSIVAESEEAKLAVQAKAKEAGVPTAVYYPIPLHQQTAFAGSLGDPEGIAVSEDIAKRIFSLPMHPYLTEAEIDRVVAAIS